VPTLSTMVIAGENEDGMTMTKTRRITNSSNVILFCLTRVAVQVEQGYPRRPAETTRRATNETFAPQAGQEAERLVIFRSILVSRIWWRMSAPNRLRTVGTAQCTRLLPVEQLEGFVRRFNSF
jgi:hypothetical protein